ncbi:MAG: PsiF family protein [Pseudomonadota bacterium]|jgi:hypothetical protein|nr:PsiF family protein [Pseudomonadota bacterium]
MRFVRYSPVLIGAVLLSSPVLAQTQPHTAPTKSMQRTITTTKSTSSTTRAPVVRTAKSLDCSKQADSKGLHGKPRKSFMSSCKKG